MTKQKNHNPLVSVCVMTYQHAKYIYQCIESILMQKTNFNYEIIIGEDESTDGTREICQHYVKKHPAIIKLFLRSRKDVIYIDNCPTGRYNFVKTIQAAKGTYIAYVDGDDYWTNEHKLQKQVDFMIHNPEYSGCFHETQTISTTGAYLKKYGDTQKKRLTAEDFIDTTAQIHISSLLFKKEYLEFPDWFYKVTSADIGLFSIITKKGALGKVNGVMSTYRKHGKGISSTDRVQKNFHEDRIRLIQHMNKYHGFEYQNKSFDVINKHIKALLNENSNTKVNTNIVNNFINVNLTKDNIDTYIVRVSIFKMLKNHLTLFSGLLLDVGCGEMPYRDYILSHNPAITKYIGLDFPQGKYADLRQPDLTWDGHSIPLADASADCAMATEVLEHCFKPSIVFQEIKRVLKPGGVFFFTVPFLWPIHDAPHDHYRYTPYALQKLLADADFEDIKIEA
ncbi:MAG: glycosyltransferase, partial [Ignavibacteria bacterium]|nr:glycosyltransferase [Ignavibacteria bacterium]